MTTITLPDWFLWAMLGLFVLHIALECLRLWWIHELKRICRKFDPVTAKNIFRQTSL